jgi:hypothetical protein
MYVVDPVIYVPDTYPVGTAKLFAGFTPIIDPLSTVDVKPVGGPPKFEGWLNVDPVYKSKLLGLVPSRNIPN